MTGKKTPKTAAEPEGGTPGSDDPAPPVDAGRTASLEAEVADLKERLARARADYDNLQKRTARDAGAERERNRARVLEAFLPLCDLAHAAASQAEHHGGNLAEGVALLAREFDRMLGREGVQRIGAVGDPADARLHEVVAAEAADGVAPGCVSRVVQAGYALEGKVLRFAKVCVAPAPVAPSPPSGLAD